MVTIASNMSHKNKQDDSKGWVWSFYEIILILICTRFDKFSFGVKSVRANSKYGSIKNNSEQMDCSLMQRANRTTKTKVIHLSLTNIDREDCSIHGSILEQNNNLFFVESSGKDYLDAREACAIESAIQNSGYAGHIIIAMTSPVINVIANNATCHLYTRYGDKAAFFRYVNLDTIFRNTGIHKFYLDGGFKHKIKKETVVRYRYS